MPTSDIKVFAGNSNTSLANQVAEHLELPLGRAKIGRFSDGEVMVDIDECSRSPLLCASVDLSTCER